MVPDIKDAIYGVFESKTSDELRAAGAREAMKEPVLEAIRELYNEEEDRENIARTYESGGRSGFLPSNRVFWQRGVHCQVAAVRRMPACRALRA